MPPNTIRVLLVEDNPGDLWLIHNYLAESKQERFSITNAQTLAECIAALEHKSFDIVLTDLSLPDCAGLDTFKKIHARVPTVATIILTGLDDSELALQGVRAGAQDYLFKNKIDGELLTRSIRYALERNRAEKALAESENRYRSLIETIHEGFAIVDGDEKILLVNQAYCDMLGYTQKELTGRSVTTLVHPNEIPKTLEATFIKKTQKKPTRYEVVMMRKDGTMRNVLVSSTPLLYEFGNFKVTIGVAMDITEQKRNELELKEKSSALNAAYHRVNELLQNILPNQVIKELEKTAKPVPRSVPNVTIVFIDIVDFSNTSIRYDPKALISKLSTYFHAFDEIILWHGLEKLKTFGDGYMFAGGLFADGNQLEECAQASLDILDYVQKHDWKVRIGMHVGSCIAGLIEGWRMIYDVWGNTVNLAARLEQTSMPGRINVSEEVHHELNSKFNFEDRGLIEIHNFKPRRMYFLTGKHQAK
jgi:adenylate cyclase